MEVIKAKKKQGSLKEIATSVGLSVSAVSQILNNKPNDFSSDNTKERVRQVAREVGYRQKFSHKLMRGDRTNTTAILLSLARLEQEEHIQLLINNLTRISNAAGYITYIYRLTTHQANNSKIIRELVDRGVEQFILIGPPLNCIELTNEIESAKRNWICYGPLQGGGLKRTINPDIQTGTELVIRHFLERGLSNFRLLIHNDADRIAGLCRVFPDKTREELIQRYVRFIPIIEDEFGDFLNSSDHAGEVFTDQLLDKEPDVQAIFYNSDYVATGGIRTLLRRNCKIGSDIVIAGFNNIHGIRVSPFPVISVEHDTARTVEQLIRHAKGQEPLNELIKPTLIIR